MCVIIFTVTPLCSLSPLSPSKAGDGEADSDGDGDSDIGRRRGEGCDDKVDGRSTATPIVVAVAAAAAKLAGYRQSRKFHELNAVHAFPLPAIRHAYNTFSFPFEIHHVSCEDQGQN